MSNNIESHLVENRVFKPSKEFSKSAHIGSFAQYRKMYKESIKKPEKFWAEQAAELLWNKKWTKVLDLEGALREVVRRRQAQRLARTASTVISRAAPQQGGDHLGRRAGRDGGSLTYQQLHREVCRFANVLKRNRLQEGRPRHHLHADDSRGGHRHARLRAHRRVALGGLRRIQRESRSRIASADCGASIGHHRGRRLSARPDRAAESKVSTQALEDGDIHGQAGHRLPARAATTFTSRKAATSGGTAKWSTCDANCPPRRSTASIRFSFSTPAARPANRRASCTRPAAICSAPTVTTQVRLRSARRGRLLVHRRRRLGHRATAMSSTARSPMARPRSCTKARRTCRTRTASGASSRTTASRFSTPRRRRFARSSSGATNGRRNTISPRCACSAPSASRSIPRRGCGITSIIGGGRCPIVDTWWQTETGGHMITPLPGATPTKPGTATLPFFGVDAAVVDDDGKEVPAECRAASSSSANRGRRCCASFTATRSATSRPTGASSRACYFTGDGARRDKDGYFWIVGRIDDVLNVAGIASAPPKSRARSSRIRAVAEAAVVGRPDELKGQALVVLRHARSRALTATAELRRRIARARPQRYRPRGQAGRYPLRRSAAQDAQRKNHAPPAQGNRRGRSRQGRHHHAGRFQRACQVAEYRGIRNRLGVRSALISPRTLKSGNRARLEVPTDAARTPGWPSRRRLSRA